MSGEEGKEEEELNFIENHLHKHTHGEYYRHLRLMNDWPLHGQQQQQQRYDNYYNYIYAYIDIYRYIFGW